LRGGSKKEKVLTTTTGGIRRRYCVNSDSPTGKQNEEMAETVRKSPDQRKMKKNENPNEPKKNVLVRGYSRRRRRIGSVGKRVDSTGRNAQGSFLLAIR